MDGASLDGLLAELGARLIGRHLGRPRLPGPHALSLEVSGERGSCLWLEAGRRAPGLYLLTREQRAALAALPLGEPSGRSRHALLLLRKHLDGARLSGLRRVRGERTLCLECGRALLVLRVSGAGPALTAALDGAPIATIGDGPPAWPPPEEAPGREITALTDLALERARTSAAEAGRPPHRALLAAFPPLGPYLSRELDERAGSLGSLLDRLAAARPTLHLPAPLEDCEDAALAPPDAVRIAPFPLAGGAPHLAQPETWRQAWSAYLAARLRGEAFEGRSRAAVESARRDLDRLMRLGAHLERDLAGLPDPGHLRRQAEALLAYGSSVARGARQAALPDPGDSTRQLRVELDPSMAAVANANVLFSRARRAERGRRQIEARIAQTGAALEAARRRLASVAEARSLADLPRVPMPAPRGRKGPDQAAPRSYLTSRGILLLVGRSARENHRLTFEVAGPEDLWLHARGVPGAHVILRDREGRAGPEDVREAAEVAAHFSDAAAEAAVDVHLTRRKHVRPGRGAPGRVLPGQVETLRVGPRDPEGRLRRG